GETPSPQMVAAAGTTAGLRSRTAVLCLVGVIVALAVSVYLNVRTSALERMGLDHSPEILTQRAKDIVAQLGYDKHPADSGYGLYANNDVIEYLTKLYKHPDWNQILAGRSSVLQFWYRQSPRYMMPETYHDSLLTPGILKSYDPD